MFAQVSLITRLIQYKPRPRRPTGTGAVILVVETAPVKAEATAADAFIQL